MAGWKVKHRRRARRARFEHLHAVVRERALRRHWLELRARTDFFAWFKLLNLTGVRPFTLQPHQKQLIGFIARHVRAHGPASPIKCPIGFIPPPRKPLRLSGGTMYIMTRDGTAVELGRIGETEVELAARKVSRDHE